MNIFVHQATDEDIEQVFEIQEEVGLSFWSIQDYKIEITNRESIFLIIKNDYRVVGFILVRLITSLGLAEISNIGIKKDFQNQGFGKILFNQIISKLKSLQINKIELEVREKNTQAINFYHKNQFKQDGIRKNFYENPKDNAVLMSREI